VSDPRELPELEVAKEAQEENSQPVPRPAKRAVVFRRPLGADTEMAGALRLAARVQRRHARL
jgi:hypothetical protein